MPTPARAQYLDIKRKYPDTILFFRMGDFYETFDDDARLVSSALDIVLTKRESKGTSIPMAGVPYHAAEGYIARLIALGHRVAVCEQMGEPNGKQIVDRRVTKVITPGTVDQPSMLDARRNNYLVAVAVERGAAGLAYADVTTGEFRAVQVRGQDSGTRMLEEIGRLAPAEIVVPAGRSAAEPSAEQQLIQQWKPAVCPVISTEPWRWRPDRAAEVVREVTGAGSLEGFGLDGAASALRAVGGLLQYLLHTNPQCVSTLAAPSTYSLEAYMPLDERTRRNLELTESNRGERSLTLLAVLDRTRTPMGSRRLRQWVTQPLLEVEPLQRRLDSVEWLVSRPSEQRQLRDALSGSADLERLVNRAVQGSITPRELRSLGSTLRRMPELRRTAADVEGFDASRLAPMPDLVDLLLTAIVDDPPAQLGAAPCVREGYSAELDGIRSSAREARHWIARLEKSERERTGIRTLKVGFNKVFGYYLEISNANRSLIPESYIRKQTLVGAERFITPELKEYEALISASQSRAEEVEASLYRQIVCQVAAAAGALMRAAAALAELDCLLSFAAAALTNRYIRPQLSDGTCLDIRAGRHPVVERRTPDGFISNDACLDVEAQQIVILTGPNMAGKSTYLRQVALIVLMAQIGSFVPAERAEIGLVDRIFTRVGAQDDISSGQSTFMVEMTETAHILAHCTPRSLLVLDEIGRGTSTYDGLAIAQAVVEYVHNHPPSAARTLFATHYHELTALAGVLPRVRNYRMDVLEEGSEVVFLRRVVPGGADRSYGIHVAKLAGIPRAVLRRAEDLLRGLEHSERHPRTPSAEEQLQLSFIPPDDSIVTELASLDVDSLSPIESLTRLYELKKRAASQLGVGSE